MVCLTRLQQAIGKSAKDGRQRGEEEEDSKDGSGGLFAAMDAEGAASAQTCEVPLNCNSGIFVTMNPASREYGGRSKLPAKLKQLFRRISMTKPDSRVIADILLKSESFRFSAEWAPKTVELFNLSKHMLSRQRHYDWGLRALKAILNAAGRLLREELARSSSMSDESVMSATQRRRGRSALQRTGHFD